MATDEYDPYAGTTGLKENFDGTITAAAFYKEPEKANYVCQVTVKADDGDDVELRYGLGKDWASYDGGETAEHVSGYQFNNRTAYWDFVNKAVLAEKKTLSDGQKSEIRTRGSVKQDEVGRDLGPRLAESWAGLRFHFDIFQIPGQRKDKETDEWVDTNADGTPILFPRTLPTAYLGIAPIQGDLWAPAPSVPVPESTAPTVAPSIAGDLGLSPSDWTKLTLLAKSHDYSAFVDAVMNLQSEKGTDMVSNRDLMARLADESFYTGLARANRTEREKRQR